MPSPHGSQGNIHPPHSHQDGSDRPNTPLKAIAPAQRSRLPNTLASPTTKSRGRVKPLTNSTNLTWTRARLEKERNDWWDTQVTGSQEIWGAIRLAAQYLQAGELQEAQTMLDATGCTCPTGCLWRGVYDSTGVMYKVPEWLIVEPEGLVEESSDDEGEAAGPAEADKAAELDDDDNEEDDLVLVRIRNSRTQRDVPVNIRSKETVAAIVEKFRKHAQLEVDTKVRLAYGGRLYQDYETLESNLHWSFTNEYIITALVTG